MTSISANVPGTGTIGDMFAIATRNASTGGDLAITASQIVAKRVALGIAAAMDPLRADHAEFERMVPEKVEAFSVAGMIMLEQSGQANRQMTRLASDAAMATARATIAMTGCSSPGDSGTGARQIHPRVVRSSVFELHSDGNASARRPGGRYASHSADGLCESERLGR